ncbi:hydroxyacylglutathione hydrolase [Aestuariivirga sp.]|uniref:hydroxyacylglutathione hydrolase n=1 Tax=Aestuariivirga sp. TaxID=2650926 RepID=UPI003594473C
MAHLEMHQFICRSDNYGLLVHDHKSGATASIDAPDAVEIEKQLRKRGWQLTHIFSTHHHGDHVEGNAALKNQFSCVIIGPRAEADRIPGIRTKVSGGEAFTWAGREVKVLACLGHTLGHIAYHIPSEYSVFAGDTLFSLGCGRVFEGTLEQMYHSVTQFKTLSPSTYLYCGHEYTEANARFALSIEPMNRMLQQRASIVATLRREGKMTCPSTIGEELKANPFLRTDSPEIRRNLNMETATDADVFAELRRRKDSFK